MFMRVLCMSFLLGPWFVTMDRCLGLNIKGRSGDKGEPLKYPSTGGRDSGLLTATGTAAGPRGGKGLGSHTTKGRLRQVQCSWWPWGPENTLGNLSILGVMESSLAPSIVCVNPNLLKVKHVPNSSRDHSG